MGLKGHIKCFVLVIMSMRAAIFMATEIEGVGYIADRKNTSCFDKYICFIVDQSTGEGQP